MPRHLRGLSICAIALTVACGGSGSEDSSAGSTSDEVTSSGASGEDDSATVATDASDTSDTSESSDEGDESTSSETGDTGPGPIDPEVRNYIFGHSLLLHSDTQNVPRWLADFSAEAGHSYAMAGQYGFSDTHAMNLPPIAQWGVTGVTPAWDSDMGESFADAQFNLVLFTAANFRHYYPPTETDPDGILPTSIVDNTLAVFDWVDQVGDPDAEGMRYIIYENWPDMGGFTGADFSSSYPSESELSAYYDYTRGDFHDWWLDYQDAMLAARPELRVRMVPVGPVIFDLLEGPLADIPPEALYEDNAPHGQTTLYFLAGLVTYAAVYGEAPPADYAIPSEIHPSVAANYDEVRDAIWTALNDFDDGDGQSRVW